MFNGKKSLEEVPKENTPIWSCTKDGCNGWMRANFTFDHLPTCPLCTSPMESGMKMLAPLTNFSNDTKTVVKSEQD